MKYKKIKCKKCERQDLALFMASPPISNNDCYCRYCLDIVMQERAKVKQ